MAKRKSTYAKFQSAKGGKFYPLYADLINSSVFDSLSPNATKIFLYLYRKYSCKVEHNIITKTNYNDISFTKDEIKLKRKEGVGLPSYNPSMEAIDELIEKGFLILVKSGYETKTCNIYGFYHGWQISNYEPEDKHRRNKKNL